MPVGEPSSDEDLVPISSEIIARMQKEGRRTAKRLQRKAERSEWIARCGNRQTFKKERAKQWNLGSKADGFRSHARSVAAPAVVAPPAPDDDGTVITNRLIEDRVRARSLEHLMCHSPPCATCEGCQARARAKKHHKGSVEASPKDRSMIVIMDQLSVQDLDFIAGYGGFKYGIVYCSLRTDYWIFIPLRSMGCADAHTGFRQFVSYISYVAVKLSCIVMHTSPFVRYATSKGLPWNTRLLRDLMQIPLWKGRLGWR